MKKLKIGFFMDDFYPSINGVISVMDNYAKRLSKIAEVVIVVPYVDKTYVDNFPYRVVRVKSHKLHILDYHLGKLRLDRKTEKMLLNENFDIIHIHSPFMMGYHGVRIAKKLNIPCIATMHTQFYLEFKRYSKSDFISKRLTNMIMRVFNKCYKCYAVNEAVSDLYVTYGAKVKPGVLPNGTEFKTLLNGSGADKEINKKYELAKDEKVLLFLGRVNLLKNILFIVDVAKELKDKGFKFKLMFVGTLEDGDTLIKKINKNGLQDDVIITGKVMDRDLIAKIYHRANLFVFPSLYDASSIVQIEASSQKTPTIFIEGATTACSVVNNQNGFLAPNDPGLFADRIIEIFDNPELYNKVCQGAYKELYRHWDDLTKSLYKEYQKIIKEYKQNNTK